MEYFPFVVQTARDSFSYSPSTNPSALAIESLTIAPDAMTAASDTDNAESGRA